MSEFQKGTYEFRIKAWDKEGEVFLSYEKWGVDCLAALNERINTIKKVRNKGGEIDIQYKFIGEHEYYWGF